MNRSLLPHLLFLAIWLVGGAFFFNKKCANCDAPLSGAVSSTVAGDKETAEKAIKLSQVLFESSSYQLADATKESLDTYMTAFAESKTIQELEIEGGYMKGDVNTSQYPDLGLARAIMAKNYLAQKGLDVSKVSIRSKKQSSSGTKNHLRMKLLDSKTTTIDFAEVLNKPIQLYFEKEALTLSEVQKENLFQISRYLDQQSVGMLMVEGHTDSAQEWSKSMNMANKKALFVSELLIENGIPEDRLSTIAYGPNRPLESNKTKEGRAKNSRVTLILKGKK